MRIYEEYLLPKTDGYNPSRRMVMNIQEIYRKTTFKYKIFGEAQELFHFLVNNFPKNSPAIEENFKKDSPILLAFEEFKSIIG